MSPGFTCRERRCAPGLANQEPLADECDDGRCPRAVVAIEAIDTDDERHFDLAHVAHIGTSTIDRSGVAAETITDFFSIRDAHEIWKRPDLTEPSR
jgi:hypothetical protein